MQLILRRRAEDERGATLVFMAIVMILLLGMAGLVVDLGLVRSNRQRNKSVADVAATAGMRGLNLSGSIAPFRGACAALDYVKANHPELATLNATAGWTDGFGNAVGGNPCDPASAVYSQTCDTTSSTAARQTFAWYTGTTSNGSLTVKVKAGYTSGYPNSDMDNDNMRDDFYNTDTGDATKFGCDQLAVAVTERESAGFGRVIGAGELSSTSRSVGRVTVGLQQENAIGLLLLERNDCDTVDVGDTNSIVGVLGSGANPGIIHSDSLGDSGSAGDCNSKSILYGGHSGPPVVSPSPSPAPGIMAYAAPNAPYTSGFVSTRATTNAIDHANNVVAQGGSVSTRDLAGRYAVDSKYRPAVDNLLTEAVSRTNWVAAPPAARTVPSGWTITGCTPSPADLAETGSVFVNCGDFAPPGAVTFEASEIVFNGEISLSNASLSLPNAHKVYVYGKTSGGNPPAAVDLGPSSALKINVDPAVTTCPTSAGAVNATTNFVIANGALTSGSSGVVQMCQTFMFLADGGTLPSSTSAPGPAPADNGRNGVIRVQSGSTIDWTAPNMFSTKPTAANMATSPFEDLAFWSEASGDGGSGHAPPHILTGGGSLRLRGVVFAPNANAFRINGGSSGAITQDAQFIVRKLALSGGAVLNMRANPEDSVSYPYFKGYDLVR
jgi:Flp pilus assembly protein TadG